MVTRGRLVALRSLVRDAGAYRGETIITIGFAELKDGARLYSSEGEQHGVELARRPESSELHHRFVLVQGVVREGPVLDDVTRFEAWSDPLEAREPVDAVLARRALGSIGGLIEDPKSAHDRIVTVVGFAASSFESSALYVSEEAQRNAVTKDAIWIERPPDSKIDRAYVTMRGRFDALDEGRHGMYSGTLREVEVCERLSPPKHPVFLLVPRDFVGTTAALLERAERDAAVIVDVGETTRLFFAGSNEVARRLPGGESLAEIGVLGDGVYHVDTGGYPGSVDHLARYARWLMERSRVLAPDRAPLSASEHARIFALMGLG